MENAGGIGGLWLAAGGSRRIPGSTITFQVARGMAATHMAAAVGAASTMIGVTAEAGS